jgi:hypothetical protein
MLETRILSRGEPIAPARLAAAKRRIRVKTGAIPGGDLWRQGTDAEVSGVAFA